MRPLTARQREVLRLVAAGHTNAQVGRRLNTEPATINKHMSEIFKRMDVHDRAHAVALAIYTGEITIADLAAIGTAHNQQIRAVPQETAA